MGDQDRDVGEEEEGRLSLEEEERVRFIEGYYLHTATGEVWRASLAPGKVLWWEASLGVFLSAEGRSVAASRILLEELRYLPNYGI